MEIDTRSPQGNAMVIMATVRKLLIDVGRVDEIPAVMKRMRSGDYENVKAVATEISNGSITFYDGEDDSWAG